MPAEPAAVVRVAVIGDYGKAGAAEAAVAALVLGWQPDAILTTGDNNYPFGAASTIDANIGQYYHTYIGSYHGSYGAGSVTNRFFPSLGNHDWYTTGAQPYLDYFTLPDGSPGGERYYQFSWGPLDLFAVDSDPSEPDGITAGSAQAHWLACALAASTAPWQLVYMHHPPYTSGLHTSAAALRWPYGAWGADAVLAGHNHHYERLLVDGLRYFVVGTGGASLYPSVPRHPASEFAYDADYGAMLIEASAAELVFEFYRTSGELVDSVTLSRPATPVPPDLDQRLYFPVFRRGASVSGC
jgi:hypothetical protein